MLRIHFLDADTVDLGDLSLARLKRQGRYRAFGVGDRGKVLSKSAAAEVVISNKVYLGKSEMKRLPRLRLICIAATGTNNVDLAEARKHGIAVCNVAGYSTATVVEHTMMFLLAMGHRLLEHYRSAAGGRWSRGSSFADLRFPYSDLAGKTLGILGYGTIGKKVACWGKILGMNILIGKIPGRKYSKTPARVSTDALLRRSDYLSLHCPLNETTRHLLNAARLRLMKPSAFLLNLARGPLVVEAAVAAAIKAKKLAGYAADVTEVEPIPANHPLLAPALADKVLLTPHVAWASRESRQRLIEEIAANIAAFFQGRKRNRVV
jgi:glycerate dehydrogenase